MVMHLPVFIKACSNFSDLYHVCCMCLDRVPNLCAAPIKVSVWPILTPLSASAAFVASCSRDV